jgi:hypothetical protein
MGMGGGIQQQQSQQSMGHQNASPQVQFSPAQQPQQQLQQQYNPDLTSVGPHTSSAQLAALLAGVSGPPPELQQQYPSSQLPQQVPPQLQYAGGFGNQFGGGVNAYNNPNNNMQQGGMNGPTSSNPCRMYQQGHCHYGATCRFVHAGPPGTAAGNNPNTNNNTMNNTANNSFGRAFRPGGGFTVREFVPQAQQQQQQFQPQQQPQQQQQQQSRPFGEKTDVINDNTFQPQQQQQQQQQANPNAALLQALLQQQQLNINTGNAASNPQLDELIASLSKTQIGGNISVPNAANPNNPVGQDASSSGNEQNLEFLQAQAALASFASLGGAAPSTNARPQQQQPFQQPGSGFGNYPPRPQQQPQQFGGSGSGGGFAGNKYPAHPQTGFGGGHHSHGQSLPSFHAGGNFGGSSSHSSGGLFGGPPTQHRFFSDPTQRDQRSDVVLF